MVVMSVDPVAIDDTGATKPTAASVELLVMRHAKSAWDTDAPSDFERPLSGRGTKDAPRMARWLVSRDVLPDRIIASAAARTRMTVDPIPLPGPDSRLFESSLYGASAADWVTRLSGESASRILICGHNPGLDSLLMTVSRDPVPLSSSGKLMTTAAIAHLSIPDGWASLGRASARLVTIMRPRELPDM